MAQVSVDAGELARLREAAAKGTLISEMNVELQTFVRNGQNAIMDAAGVVIQAARSFWEWLCAFARAIADGVACAIRAIGRCVNYVMGHVRATIEVIREGFIIALATTSGVVTYQLTGDLRTAIIVGSTIAANSPSYALAV